MCFTGWVAVTFGHREDHGRLVEWLAAHRQTYWVATMRDVVTWIAEHKGAPVAPRQADPIVTIDSGKLEGVTEAGPSPLRIFRGVPFAAPPLADLRWREPQAVASWPGVRPATDFAPRCMQQPLYSDMMFRSPAPSEDCLYLNIWTPAKLDGSRQRKLPVLLYVYGGGFMAGDSSEKRYDGAALARRGIVVVTVNYRLRSVRFLCPSRIDGEFAAPSSAIPGCSIRRRRWPG